MIHLPYHPFRASVSIWWKVLEGKCCVQTRLKAASISNFASLYPHVCMFVAWIMQCLRRHDPDHLQMITDDTFTWLYPSISSKCTVGKETYMLNVRIDISMYTVYIYIHIIHTLYIYMCILVLHILYINGPIDMDNLMDTLDGWMDGWIDTAPATPGSAFAFSAAAMVAALARFSGSGCVRRLKRWSQAKPLKL
jgi:hypothetical protein